MQDEKPDNGVDRELIKRNMSHVKLNSYLVYLHTIQYEAATYTVQGDLSTGVQITLYEIHRYIRSIRWRLVLRNAICHKVRHIHVSVSLIWRQRGDVTSVNDTSISFSSMLRNRRRAFVLRVFLWTSHTRPASARLVRAWDETNTLNLKTEALNCQTSKTVHEMNNVTDDTLQIDMFGDGLWQRTRLPSISHSIQ